MDRNPYMILGIPFGASRADANIAFARKARTLRRDGGTETQLTDLTWALQRIDEALRTPATAMDLYRIPADPEAFQGAGSGVLRPSPEHMAAAPGDHEQALASLQHAAARDYLRMLVAVRGSRVPLPPV